MEIIEIKDLTFAYPACEISALSNININIGQGEFVTLCGKSGCGKSTLLRLLKPSVSPEGKKSGEVLFDGNNITGLDHRTQAEKIGFIMQNPDNQIVTDKVWHELAFGLENLGYSTNEIRTRVSEMALYFGIENWFHKKTADLSGGQKQMLNLASVMVIQPSVLVLDEPTSQLDPIAAQEFIKTLEKINRELGTTVIISEHRLDDAISISDRVIVMDSGKVIADGKPKEIGKLLENHDMYMALPVPVRVHGCVENEFPCPVTVREGKEWLKNYVSEHETISEVKTEYLKPSFNDVAVEVKDLWFRYDKDLPDVLKGVSFKVNKGEIYAIAGGNGAGKTTLLSLICGLNKPYRGKILFSNKDICKVNNFYDNILGVMPQNPQTMFSQKTVYQEIAEMFSENDNIGREERINEIIKLCGLERVAERHPYDLSGGEQQRTALAKILIKNPDIIIMDEPTKGMDAHFKKVFANILKTLKLNGVTIIMVSHDIEFCAEYADRCMMLFDGSVAGEDVPRKFFADKNFYTTSASRMAKGIINNAVLADDIIIACGGRVKKEKSFESFTYKKFITIDEERVEMEKKEKLSLWRILSGIAFGVLFVITLLWGNNKFADWQGLIFQFVTILEASAALLCFIPKKSIGVTGIEINATGKNFNIKRIIAIITVLIAVPLTILFGMYCLDDRKYYFISLLIIAETMMPFFVLFEGKKPDGREVVLISVICAIAIASRAAFYMIPQFKPVLAIIIIAGICFGGETGFMAGTITAFVSNFFFGQGPWTPWQMFAFGIVGFVAGIIFKGSFLKKSNLSVCIFGGLATLLIYGGIMNPASVIMYQETPTFDMILSAYIMGFPFDLLHAVSTIFFLWFLVKPMTEKIERVKIKYGLVSKYHE